MLKAFTFSLFIISLFVCSDVVAQKKMDSLKVKVGAQRPADGQLAKEQKGNGQNVFHATDAEEQKYIQQVFGTETKVMVAANFPGVLTVQPVIKKEVGYLKLVSIALISPMKNILLVLEALLAFDNSNREILRYTQDDRLSREQGVSGESSVGNWQSGVVSGETGAGSREEGGVNSESSVGSDQLSIVNIIEYNIYGPVKDKPYWDECLACIKKLPANIKVNYHGDIPPAEIVHALATNHVFILPSKSENYGHAIYEALSAGRPVITSNTT